MDELFEVVDEFVFKNKNKKINGKNKAETWQRPKTRLAKFF